MMHMHHDLPCACTAVNKASRSLTRLYDEALAPAGLSVQQFAILRHLARLGSLETCRLADVLQMERTSLYRALTPMEQAGWVIRGAAGRGRVRTVALAPGGERVMAQATPAWAAVQVRIVEAFGAQRFAATVDALAELTAGARA
jgi:DNA-binding MarR family transcriptional regulator